jgi:hypothetical protein
MVDTSFFQDMAHDDTRGQTVQKRRGRPVMARAPIISLDQPGRLRMANLMAIFGCSHTTIYQRIKRGEFPKPDGYDLPHRPVGKQGRPYWNTATIRAQLAK